MRIFERFLESRKKRTLMKKMRFSNRTIINKMTTICFHLNWKVNSAAKPKKEDELWLRLSCWDRATMLSLSRQKSNTEVPRSNCILPKRMAIEVRLLHQSTHSSCLEDQNSEGSLRMEEVRGKFLSWSIARRSTSVPYSQKIRLPVSTTKLSYSSRDWRQRPTSLTLVTNC